MINLQSSFGLGLASLMSFQAAAQKPVPTQTKLPNIVLIFIDDMGYGDVVCSGATQYNTPNIDRLASTGMRFTNFYVAQAVSSASRAGLMTGCYSNRVGISGALGPNSSIGINADEELIPELLSPRGYKNAIVGYGNAGGAGFDQSCTRLQNGQRRSYTVYSQDMGKWRHIFYFKSVR